MRILKKEKIAPIHVMPGDTIVLTYDDGYGNKTEVLSKTLTKSYTFDEAAVFELEAGEIEGWTEGLAGAFGTSEKQRKKMIKMHKDGLRRWSR